MIYATAADLLDFLGREPDIAPAGSERLLERASALVDEATLYRVNSDNEEHSEAAKIAACAIVESWLATGEAVDISGSGVEEYQVGSVRVRYGKSGVARSGDPHATLLPGRARRALLQAGLFYRAVRQR